MIWYYKAERRSRKKKKMAEEEDWQDPDFNLSGVVLVYQKYREKVK